MFFWIAFSILFLPLIILYPTKVIHRERFDRKKKYVVASNHFSNADSLIYNARFRKKFRYISKKELFKNKFTAWIMRHIGAIPVDRENISPSSFKEILSVLKNNEQLFIYPEGTRNKTGSDELQGAKEGMVVFASKGDAEILPMLIYKKPRIFRKNYIIVGEAFKVVGENPKRLTKEETEENLKIYSEKMEALRIELNEYVLRKKKKRNK